MAGKPAGEFNFAAIRVHYCESIENPAICAEVTAMEILLNGQPRRVDVAMTIADLLAELKIENRYCAVERNSLVVPREQHALATLQSGDRIEVVTLVGGG